MITEGGLRGILRRINFQILTTPHELTPEATIHEQAARTCEDGDGGCHPHGKAGNSGSYHQLGSGAQGGASSVGISQAQEMFYD